jgi:hypothetical protein
MSDLDKCENKKCPSSSICWRYLAPSAEFQWYSSYKPEQGKDKCEDFIDAKEYEK